MPAKGLVLGNEHVRVAVAGEIDESQLAILEVLHGAGYERRQRLPAPIRGAFEESGCGPLQLHQIQLPVAGKVEQLRPAAAEQRGLLPDLLHRREPCHRRLRARRAL